LNLTSDDEEPQTVSAKLKFILHETLRFSYKVIKLWGAMFSLVIVGFYGSIWIGPLFWSVPVALAILVSAKYAAGRSSPKYDSVLLQTPMARPRTTTLPFVIYGALKCVDGPDAQKLFPITSPSVTIGRGTDNVGGTAGIALSDLSVSRKHAQLTIGKEEASVVDLNSKNGTYVDGTKLSGDERHILRDGSLIKLGNTTLIFIRGPESLP